MPLEFYATILKEDGTEYKPINGLRVMQAALDRHVRTSGCKFCMVLKRLHNTKQFFWVKFTVATVGKRQQTEQSQRCL